MFKPIIHNLEKGTELFEVCQQYNKLISNKNLHGNLQEKIAQEKVWKEKCLGLLTKIRGL